MQESESKKSKTASIVFSVLFLVGIFTILSLFYSILFRSQSDISDDEKRTLQKIPVFTFSSFFNKDYQSQMEDAVGDQLLFSQQIKYISKQFYYFFTNKCAHIDELVFEKDDFLATKTPSNTDNATITPTDSTLDLDMTDATSDTASTSNFTPDSATDSDKNAVIGSEITLTDASPDLDTADATFDTASTSNFTMDSATNSDTTQETKPQKKYVYKEVLHDTLYTLDDSGWIVVKSAAPEKYTFRRYPPEMLAKVKYPKYLFFIETSESKDFTDMTKYDAFSYVKTQIPDMTGYATLTFKDFEEYKEYFYQTDHHWNWKGSYESYVKMIKMMEGDDAEVLKPTGTKTYDVIFNGSFSWQAGIKFSDQKFTVYEFDIPPYKTYINDEEKQYSHRDLYDSEETMPHSNFANHYGWYYGLDFSKVVYDFNQPEKESILVLGTSYTNAVNELIASHYNKTHILDFRMYRDEYGPIDAAKYMEENGLTKLLIIGDISSVGKRNKAK